MLHMPKCAILSIAFLGSLWSLIFCLVLRGSICFGAHSLYHILLSCTTHTACTRTCTILTAISREPRLVSCLLHFPSPFITGKVANCQCCLYWVAKNQYFASCRNTMHWIEKWLRLLEWARHPLPPCRELGEIEQRTSAVGAKIWCLYVFVCHAQSSARCLFKGDILWTSNVSQFIGRFWLFSPFSSEGTRECPFLLPDGTTILQNCGRKLLKLQKSAEKFVRTTSYR